MPITFNRQTRVFLLQTPLTTYAMGIGPLGSLMHVYWGPRVRGDGLETIPYRGQRVFSAHPDPKDLSFTFDTLPLEFPTYGRSDYRSPAFQMASPDGDRLSDLAYTGHRIFAGKPKLNGLPATYVERAAEATTLEIDLVDRKSSLKATLSYSVYANRDAITRSVTIHNGGKSPVNLGRVLSASIDMRDADFDFLQLSGAWVRERAVVRLPLRSGTQSVESRRGASSHQQNPFIALLRPGTDDLQGEVYGFSLVYSGNFLAQVEVDQAATARVQIGINPFDFAWRLEPGETFQAPEAVLVFSAHGLNGMSQVYHELYRERLARGRWRDKERPILINNWEATYFDFNADNLEKLARDARKVGIELLVLDDGWFGKRNNDRSSLGDWTTNLEKLPRGLNDLSKRVNKTGLKFGLWFEPEMISEKSELFEAHPDWCLHVPGRVKSEGRFQLVLDLSRAEVCDWVIEAIGKVLASASIDYVKWDMNRHMTEIGSATLPPERQAETAHRYMLGLYRIMEELTQRFPQVLFESCSGGGGRFDPGMLHYMPQNWTSDNSDAISRLQIQYGTSLVYPQSAMTAHVSAVPNHQAGRLTSLKTRGDVAMACNFGYELDLGSMTAAELKEVKAQVAFYRRHRKLIQFGHLYRLLSPFQGNRSAWMIVSPDQKQALVYNVDVLNLPNAPRTFLRLQGLDPKRNYQIVGTKTILGSDFLRNVGLLIPPQRHDFQSALWELKAVR